LQPDGNVSGCAVQLYAISRPASDGGQATNQITHETAYQTTHKEAKQAANQIAYEAAYKVTDETADQIADNAAYTVTHDASHIGANMPNVHIVHMQRNQALLHQPRHVHFGELLQRVVWYSQTCGFRGNVPVFTQGLTQSR
jgi:hypothetical protein